MTPFLEADYEYFLPYQNRWIVDESPMKLYPKSRRIGITYATSYRFIQKCLRKDNFTQWVSSRDLLTAKELITDYMAKWAGAANIVAKGLDGENAQVIDKEKGIPAFIVQFDNGSRVLSLSSTPEAFAGKGGDVFIDEADLHENSKKVIDMAQPCTTWGGQLEVVSALKIDGGPNTPCCRLVDEAEHQGNPRGWNLHKTTIVDAVEQGFVEKIGEVTGKNWTRKDWLANMESQYSKEAWRTQFLLIPSEDGGALISYELINAAEAKPCAQDTLMPMKYDKFLPMYLGMDIGRKKGASAVCVQMRLKDKPRLKTGASGNNLKSPRRRRPRAERMSFAWAFSF